jgi:hypothetical protein
MLALVVWMASSGSWIAFGLFAASWVIAEVQLRRYSGG